MKSRVSSIISLELLLLALVNLRRRQGSSSRHLDGQEAPIESRPHQHVHKVVGVVDQFPYHFPDLALSIDVSIFKAKELCQEGCLQVISAFGWS